MYWSWFFVPSFIWLFVRVSMNNYGFNYLLTVPRHVRQCNSVVWNPIDSNLLATALDKSRTDHSLLVWDLSRCHSHQVSATDGMVRPSAELGLSETAHSAAWLQQRNIILGMNNKHIKVFDIRGDSPWDCFIYSPSILLMTFFYNFVL